LAFIAISIKLHQTRVVFVAIETLIYDKPGQPVACGPHVALCIVSCGSYVNTIFICVKVPNFVPIVHLESRGATYTQEHT